MKIVNIIGGLGNQMFEYALYLALKNEFPEEKVKIDASYMKSYNIHNGLELNRVFGVELPQASLRELVRVTRPVYNYKLWRVIRKYLPIPKTECRETIDYTFNETVFTKGNRYYDGYWQNYRYFEKYMPLIQSVYSFKLPQNERTKVLIPAIEEDSVSVHVRRGDYLKASNYAGLCNLDYYKTAINYIKSRVDAPHFYVFSDDIEWSKTNIIPLFGECKYTIVDWNKKNDSPLDMQLMSLCHHNIIANSSFSWWAAVLNKHDDKIVCAPEKWTNTKVNFKIQMPDWKLF